MKSHTRLFSILLLALGIAACQSTPPLDTSNPASILAAANAGNEEAAAMLGPAYFTGSNGFEKNMTEAAKWLPHAVEKDNATAMAQLGFLLLNGTGVAKDEAKGVELIQRSAQANDPTGLYYLGLMNMQGIGTAANPTEGVRLLTQAAQAQQPDAMKALGDAYRDGQGVTANATEALSWYDRAGAAGVASASYAAAQLHEKGRGVPRDMTRAMDLYRQAADKGHGPSMYRLSQAYFNGVGVKKSNDEGMSWLTKASDAAEPEAMRELADRYAKGKGVPRDQAKADALNEQLRASGAEPAAAPADTTTTQPRRTSPARGDAGAGNDSASACSSFYPGRVLRSGSRRLIGESDVIVIEVRDSKVILGNSDGRVIGSRPCR